MGKGNILFCDIDDVIIDSSTPIQSYVNKYTIFETNVLKAIEQFRRNCQYYYDCVEEEYKKAEAEGRTPNVQRFPNLHIYDNSIFSKENGKFYYYPLYSARYYLEIADRLLDEFLEERDMFLELDNLPLNGKKIYDFKAEEEYLNTFKKTLRDNYYSLDEINQFCLREVQRIGSEAMETHTFPDYKALVKMDTNDIIRTNDKMDGYKERYFDRPREDVENCIKADVIEYAIQNFDRREHFSRGIVDYDAIYVPEKVNKDAVTVIQRLMTSDMIDKLCFITHHNGLREENAKRRLIKTLFPDAEFLGMRFHSEEHNIKRRGRSSKFDRAKTDDIDAEKMILLDDSKDNCNDWYKKGGKVIIYRRITDAERISKLETFDYPRITDFDYLEETLSEVIVKDKVKKI